uniref:Ribonuclease H-like domain-containing protein n=1 Tax=Tanacetum cinerariifolium TaxID=118510 RepID=A0A6L2MM70_TANCI|nr:ribonuclease H-like domain-containing protein [Tanacetum cinerariifolium]
MVTRAKAGIFKPLKRINCHVTTTSPLPRSDVHALRDRNWKESMLDEYNALITNETWVLVPRPANVNVVRSMWLFKHKFNADGSLNSLVVKPATIRTVLSLVVSRNWPIHQLDVKNVFLHGHLSETVYMHQPLGFVDPNKPDYVCHLRRSLYRLKQASRAWFQCFASYATRRSAFGLFLSQSKFIEEILERAHMQNCNLCRTPVDTESKLGSDGKPVNDPTLYRSLDGALQYLTFTRLDLSYAVQQLHVSFTTQLTTYTDADWSGYPITRRSTSGYFVFLSDNLLSWSAKRQATLSHSSVEAEYRGIANVVAETAWIGNLLCGLHTPLFTANLVYCDNVSIVYMSANPVQHQRTKHIEIDIHFVRDFVAPGQVRVLHVPSRFQYAGIFTKGLPTALFLEFRTSLNVRRPPAHTAREY